MPLIAKIGLCVCYHPFEENAENASEIFENSVKHLKGFQDFNIIKAPQLINDIHSGKAVGQYFRKEEVDVICVKLATWSSDNPILDMMSECDVPFIFWTYSHLHAGSLCGGQQFNMVFKELGKQCIFIYGSSKESLEKIKCYCRAVALQNRLKKLRLLKVGNRTQGMSEVICDEFSVKEILGPRIIAVDLDSYKEVMKKISNEAVLAQWESIKERINTINVTDEDGLRALRNYLTMKNLIETGDIEGVTVECYPRYMGEVCLGFSLLADEGIPGACEGDINALILMFILTKLSKMPVHHIDPLFFDEKENTLLGSHCGCGSCELAESKELISLENVRLANKGVCVLFPSKPGKVTMANLVGRKGTYRLTAMETEAIPTEMSFPGNPIKIQLPVKINDFLEIVEECALGHHWVIAYGHYMDELRALANLLKIDFVQI